MRAIAPSEVGLPPVAVGHQATTSSAVTGIRAATGLSETTEFAPAPAGLAADQARALLKALAEPIRLQVIESLSGGERCVCELTSELGLAQSKLSFHLKVLKQAGLITAREEGRWVYYTLRPEAIDNLRTWLAQLANQCTRPAVLCR